MTPSVPERWQRLKILFELAATAPSAERGDILRTACPDDAALREEVNKLLEIHDRSQLALDQQPALVEKFGQDFARTVATLPPSQALLPGHQLAGRFEIIRLAGIGGMGEVYEALDMQLATRVAIKTIRPDIAGDPKIISRFKREIGLSRLVTHRNVCRVFEFIEAPAPGNGHLVRFLTMEFFEGETLSSYLKREGPLSFTTAKLYIEQMSAALDAAHHAGIIHRDFKGSNVFLARERDGSTRVAVTDFGLARSYESNSAHTISTAGEWGPGTPAYMSPEQVEGKAVTAASDVYALGVVMYEMATGRQPYTGDSPMQIAVRRIKERPRPPRELNPSIDARWEALILRCLEHDPTDRPQSAAEISEALRSRSFFATFRRSTARRAALVAAVLLTCVLAGWFLHSFGIWSSAPPAQVEAWYREGLNALYDGNLATAQRALQKVVSIAPTWAEGHARMAQVLDEMDQPDLARQSMLQAVHVRSALFAPRIVDAIQSLIVRDFTAACPAFHRIAGSQPNGLMDWARCLNRADKASDAVTALDQVLKLNADHPSANLLRADLGIRLKDKPDAIRARFDRAVDGFRTLNRLEGLAEAQLQLSQWLFKQKDVAPARAMAQSSLASARAAESKYAEARALFHLARMADTSGEREEAEQTIVIAVRLAREGSFGALLAQSLIEQGIQLFTQGKIELALAQFQAALQESDRAHSPRNHARALVWHAAALSRLNRFTDAEDSYRKAEQEHRTNQFPREALRARLGLADVLRLTNRRPESLAMLESVQREAEALSDRDLTTETTVKLGDLYTSFGEFPAALRYYRQWNVTARDAAIAEDICNSSRVIIRTLTNLARFSEAREHLTRLAADARCQQPHHITERGLTEGLILTEENRIPEALQLFRTMLKKAEQDQQSRLIIRLKNQICFAAILGDTPQNTATACGDRFRDPEKSLPAQYNAADMLLKTGNYTESRKRAEISRAANAALGNHDNTYYSLLIRGQAEKRAGDFTQLAATIQECETLRQDFVKRWGQDAASYFSRPFYDLRWKEISGSRK